MIFCDNSPYCPCHGCLEARRAELWRFCYQPKAERGVYVSPSLASPTNASAAEIAKLKERVDELEQLVVAYLDTKQPVGPQ